MELLIRSCASLYCAGTLRIMVHQLPNYIHTNLEVLQETNQMVHQPSKTTSRLTVIYWRNEEEINSAVVTR